MHRSALAGVAGALALGAPALAQNMYATTSTHLVRFDISNPSAVTVVGPHGLSSAVRPSGSPYGVGELAYDSRRDQLVGLFMDYQTVTDTWDQYIATFDRTTGAGTIIISLGNTFIVGLYDSIAYDPGRDVYLVPNTDDFFGDLFLSSEIIAVTPTGSTSLLAVNDRDNDSSTFDTDTGEFLAVDVNGSNFNTLQLTTTDLVSWGVDQLGTIPLFMTDLTHRAGTRNVYSYIVPNTDPVWGGNSRHLMLLNLSSNPLTASSLGEVGHPDILFGLQLAPLPCPADLNGDGITDNGDINAFIVAFLGGDLIADFNGDGLLDNGDIGVFIAAFLAGC